MQFVNRRVLMRETKRPGDNGTRSVEMKRKAISRRGSIRRVKRRGHITTLMVKLRREREWGGGREMGMEGNGIERNGSFVRVCSHSRAPFRQITARHIGLTYLRNKIIEPQLSNSLLSFLSAFFLFIICLINSLKIHVRTILFERTSYLFRAHRPVTKAAGCLAKN